MPINSRIVPFHKCKVNGIVESGVKWANPEFRFLVETFVSKDIQPRKLRTTTPAVS